jgi:ABC-2 type transport system permease protein
MLAKFSVRALFIYGVLLVLFLIAWVILALPLTESFVALMVLSILYLAFWFCLSFWLSTFKRSSGFNVLALLTVWVSLTILLPSAINNFVASAYPVPEALSTLVKQRDGYHKKWDSDKKATLQKFYDHYPQFEKYGMSDEKFWLWYYAMQQMGDDESAKDSQAMREKLLQREAVSKNIAVAIPSMHAQMQMNELARTGLSDYLRLLENAGRFHERTRLYFYPRIAENADTKAEDWRKFQPEFLPAREGVSWISMILPLIIVTTLFTSLAFLRAKKLYSL